MTSGWIDPHHEHIAHQEKQLQQSPPEELDVSLVDLLIVLGRHIRLLTIAPLVVGLAALGASFLMKPIYTASTQLLPPQQQQSGAMAALLGSVGGLAGSLGGMAGLKTPADQWIGLLKSRAVADALVDKFELQKIYESEYRFQARDGLAASTRITTGKDGLIDIEVDDRDPGRAAKMANAYVDELQRLTKTLAVTEAAQRRLFFQKQLSDAKDGLVKAEIALKESGVSLGTLKASPEVAVGQVAQLQAAVVAQEVKVSVMRGSLTENNPEFRLALSELSSLRSQLSRVELDTPPQRQGNNAQYISRYREFKYHETLFELFAKQYEMARADEARDGAIIQIVDAAQVPEYKSKPKRGLIAVLATALAFIVLSIHVLVSHAMRRYKAQPEGQAKMAELRNSLRWRHD